MSVDREIEIAAAVLIDAAGSLCVDLKVVLAEAEKQRAVREALDDEVAPRHGGRFRVFTAAALCDPRYNELPDRRFYGAVMRAKARIAHCFTRDVTNENSHEDAVKSFSRRTTARVEAGGLTIMSAERWTIIEPS